MRSGSRSPARASSRRTRGGTGRVRARLAASLGAAAAICALTGVWFGAIACGFVSLAALVQSGSVVFSNGREYWFR